MTETEKPGRLSCVQEKDFCLDDDPNGFFLGVMGVDNRLKRDAACLYQKKNRNDAFIGGV